MTKEQQAAPQSLGPGATPATSDAVPAATTAGGMLRQARETAGIHVAMLAATMKVSPRKIEALENDRFDALPDLAFARALAQTMCRSLKVDAEPILAKMPALARPQGLEHAANGMKEPFRERGDAYAVESPTVAFVRQPSVWITAAILGAAALLYAAPKTWFERVQAVFGASTPSSTSPSTSSGTGVNKPGSATANPSTSPVAPTSTVSASSKPSDGAASPTTSSSIPPAPPVTPVLDPSKPVVVMQPPVVVAPAGGVSAPAGSSPALGNVVGGVVGGVSAAAGLIGPTRDPVAPGTTVVETVGTSSTGSAAVSTLGGAFSAATGLLVVHAKAKAWVEVQDASGQSLVARTVQAGEVLSFDGPAPFKLRLGNTSGTEVRFRGDPVDVTAKSVGNTIRMELK